jgi:hypothetical protein
MLVFYYLFLDAIIHIWNLVYRHMLAQHIHRNQNSLLLQQTFRQLYTKVTSDLCH